MRKLQVLASAAVGEVEWLGTSEAAERLGVVPRTLYRLLDEGQIPVYRIGRVLRIKAADLDAFLETTRVEPGTLSHLYPESSRTDA